MDKLSFQARHKREEGWALFLLFTQLTTIAQKLDTTMSKITDFAAALAALNDKQDATIADISTEIKTLNDQVTALQASLGTLSAEDQAALDSVLARGQSIAAKLAALDTIAPADPAPAPAAAPAVQQ